MLDKFYIIEEFLRDEKTSDVLCEVPTANNRRYNDEWAFDFRRV